MSKELKALNDMLEYLLTYDEFNEERHRNNAKLIETALKDYEEIKSLFYAGKPAYKRLKALVVIEEKNVDVDFFKYCCQEFNYDEVGLEQYNTRHIECSNNGKPLIKEEYDLLKEVLL